MVSKIIIPSLGATGGDVVIEQWLVKPGDRIEAGAPLVTISTDKANVDIEAFRGGFIRKLLVDNGAGAAIGTAIAIVADSMDEPLGNTAEASQGASAELKSPPSSSSSTTSDVVAQLRNGKEAPTFGASRLLASPLARRIAASHGIDLKSIQGSGRRGEIHRDDVMRRLAQAGGMRVTPMSPMRKAIARRTRQSKSDIPHFYVTSRIDMTTAMLHRVRSAARAESVGWTKPSVTDITIAAAARALRRVPELNVSYREDAIAFHEEVNVGVVVALSEGMMIPVIRSADRKDIFELAAAMRGLKDKATAGTLSSGELAGGTFTISNLGMFGVDNFIGVINPPEAAILALGTIRNELALVDGNLVEKSILTATLSADHRAVDGVTAARFLSAFKDILENPTELFARRKGTPR